MKGLSDGELAGRAGDGDRSAFGELVERHYDLIYRVAYRVLGNRADAEDAAHDVCLALAGKIASFTGKARFTTWLYQVVLNTARDHMRKQVRGRALSAAWVETDELVQAGHKDRQKQAAWIYEGLAQMKDDLRETALLVLAEGLSHAEAGEILNIKEATVSWRMHEVRKVLKEMAGAIS